MHKKSRAYIGLPVPLSPRWRTCACVKQSSGGMSSSLVLNRCNGSVNPLIKLMLSYRGVVDVRCHMLSHHLKTELVGNREHPAR